MRVDRPRSAAVRLAKRLWREQRYRVVFSTAMGLVFHALYALYHGVLGVANRSLWFVAMCAFHAVLSSMRLCVVLCERKRTAPAFAETARFVARLCGGLLILFSFVLSGVIYLSLAQDIAIRHHEIVMITIATYTFYKITLAVLRATRRRPPGDPLLAVTGIIGYAEVAASLLTLQRSMLVSFGQMAAADRHRMNALTGLAVCLFILALGVWTLLKNRPPRRA